MTDILFDSSYDLEVFAGDWAIGDSTSQEVEDIIISYPGWFKEFPLVGVAAPSYLNSPGNGQALAASIKLQLRNDNKQVQSYSANMTPNGVLTINVNGIEVVIE